MYAPEFYFTPNSTIVANQNTSLTLRCIASGAPTPSVHWERVDGEIQAPANNINVESWISNGTEFVSSSLELSSLQSSDGGRYSCVANNSIGSIYHSVMLIIEGKLFQSIMPCIHRSHHFFNLLIKRRISDDTCASSQSACGHQ